MFAIDSSYDDYPDDSNHAGLTYGDTRGELTKVCLLSELNIAKIERKLLRKLFSPPVISVSVLYTSAPVAAWADMKSIDVSKHGAVVDFPSNVVDGKGCSAIATRIVDRSCTIVTRNAI